MQAAEGGEKRLSNALMTELSAQKTAALAATLMKKRDIALAVTVHALACDAFFDDHRSCAGLRRSKPDLDGHLFAPARCKALKVRNAEEKRWRKKLPNDASLLFTWCLERKREELLDLLAFLTAQSIDAVVWRGSHHSGEQLAHADALAAECVLDIADRYRPAADKYFAKLPRACILAAIKEATGNDAASAWLKLKRDKIARKAAKLIAPTSWIPLPLRRA